MPWTINKTDIARATLTDAQEVLKANALAADPTLVDHTEVVSISLRRPSPGSPQWDVELVLRRV